MGKARADNPVDAINWFWDDHMVTNAVEITPEVFWDVERGFIDEERRLAFPGEEDKSVGPLPIKLIDGKCRDINKYIKGNTSLNLKARMSTYDKRCDEQLSS